MGIIQKLKSLPPVIKAGVIKAFTFTRDRLVKVWMYVKLRLARTAAFLKKGFSGAGTFLKRLLKRIKLPRGRYIVIAGVLLLFIVGAVYVAITFIQIQDPQRVLLGKASGGELRYDVDEEFSDNIVNIAIFGIDREPGKGDLNTDFIAVFSINFETNNVSLLRILRDTYLPAYVPGHINKINAAYYVGYTSGKSGDPHRDGIEYAFEAIKHLLGGVVPIHYYISIEMDGLVYMVDAMGGIEFRVREHVYDSHGNRLLGKGTHHFTGENFLAYVRHRDDHTGQDVGRVQRQFDILWGAFKDFRDRGVFKTIPTVFKLYRDYIKTDLNLKQIAALAYYAADFNLTRESVTFHYFDGYHDTRDGIWYWVLYQSRRVSLLREIFGIEVAAFPQETLVDTPPPPIDFFEYAFRTDKDDDLQVFLSWEPGDANERVLKNLKYELYRDGELIAELEDNSFLDTNVIFGKVYDYSLVVKHYRAEGKPKDMYVHVRHIVTGLKVFPECWEISVDVDEEDYYYFFAKVLPDYATIPGVEWEIINQYGELQEEERGTWTPEMVEHWGYAEREGWHFLKVEAVQAGQVIVIVTTKDGDFFKEWIVEVQPKPNGNGNGGD